MNASENYLVQLFTGKPSLQETTVDELEAIALRHPYFSVAQLLLAKKIKQEQPQHFSQQLQHCGVYFPNMAWLQSQLHSKTTAISITDKAVAQQVSSENKINEPQTDEENNNVAIAKNESVENNNLITLSAEDVLANFKLQIDDVKAEPELPPIDEEELVNIDDETHDATAKISDVLQHQIEDFKAPVEATNVPISTEPYHTIDYFASQGIKVDAQATDSFSKKVHTFTDWLRQMKRITTYPTDLGSDPDMESYVQSIANTSNQSKAVDTEAMAEVLVKQGKLDKAIEVYQKLSLLNPGKTAYFAAKISQLKIE